MLARVPNELHLLANQRKELKGLAVFTTTRAFTEPVANINQLRRTFIFVAIEFNFLENSVWAMDDCLQRHYEGC